jgi:hypothetical protein
MQAVAFSLAQRSLINTSAKELMRISRSSHANGPLIEAALSVMDSGDDTFGYLRQQLTP